MKSAVAQPRPPAAVPSPDRVLIVSADIGAGHNAVGRALEEAIGKAWPGCEVAWLDSLEVMGPGAAPLARASGSLRCTSCTAGACGAATPRRRPLCCAPSTCCRPRCSAFARATYTGAWFSTVVSVFPGIRRPCYLLGAQIGEVYPVLAPGGGTGLAIGAITWGVPCPSA